MLRFCRLLLLSLLLPCFACASGPPTQAPLVTDTAPASVNEQKLENAARLQALWRERSQNGVPSDFPVGPGDVLEIDVPGLVELEDREVRIAADGTIRLPLLGVVPVAGLTQRELSDDLGRRLEESVMYDPSVVVFVREYRSRIVSVIGAVSKPGFYSLSSESETLLDVIAQAGGRTERAAQRVYLIPVTRADEDTSPAVPRPSIGPGAGTHEIRHQDPIVLDLSQLSERRDVANLSLPMRPGDVVTIPEKGRVLVKGWVKSPGGFEVTSDLSVLGAVSAAGGTRFAADKGDVTLVRIDDELGTLIYRFDLEKLQNGEQLDVSIQSGDVLDVSHSAARWTAWGLYDLTIRMFNFGRPY
jgi:polysaccharide export outer membrane protein